MSGQKSRQQPRYSYRDQPFSQPFRHDFLEHGRTHLVAAAQEQGNELDLWETAVALLDELERALRP